MTLKTIGKSFNYVYGRFFKKVKTGEYFFYRDGKLIPTGIQEGVITKAFLEDWKAINLPKL